MKNAMVINFKKNYKTAIYIQFVNMIRKLASLFGGELISQREHQLLLKQRALLISELLSVNCSNYETGLSCIVFSKDRALQLYAMLETYFKFVTDPVPLTIIYHASDELHERAYSELVDAFVKYNGRIKFVREDLSFRESLLLVLAGIKTKNIFFLTDDNIFIRKVSLRYASTIDPSISILSFRHSPHLRFCYTTGNMQKPPTFIRLTNKLKLVKFSWFEQGDHWSDPWSVDGHVFSTLEVLVLSRISDFHAPNSFESVLKSFNDLMFNRFGICYEESIILNLPINRVQSEFQNKSGTVSSDYLLEQWNKGCKLNTSVFENMIPVSTHEEHEICFQKREPFAGVEESKL